MKQIRFFLLTLLAALMVACGSGGSSNSYFTDSGQSPKPRAAVPPTEPSATPIPEVTALPPVIVAEVSTAAPSPSQLQTSALVQATPETPTTPATYQPPMTDDERTGAFVLLVVYGLLAYGLGGFSGFFLRDRLGG